MIALGLAGTLLALAVSASAPPPSPQTLEEYERAAAEVKPEPDAHIRLALWCETHGLQAERVKHLALAVLKSPTNATARGLLGLVAYRGRWQRPEVVEEKVRSDAELGAALAEYNARRGRAANTAEAQWRLALWCEQHGLAAEAKAHLSAVVRLDPGREAAWKRLGCKKHRGRWLTDAQIAAEKDEAETQKKADERWKPLLARWRGWLGNKAKHDEAERHLAAVADPHAVPSIWSVFVEQGGTAGSQARAVQLLGQINAPRASRALALLAVFSDSADVRRAAIETLRDRDTREFLGPVIGLLRKRLRYEVRPVAGPGSPGLLFVEGERFNVQRLYAPPPLPNLPLFPGEPITFDAYGLPVVTRFLGSTVETSQSTQTDVRSLGPPPEWALASVRHVGLNPARFTTGPSESTIRTTTTTTPVEHSLQIPIGQLMLQYEMSALVARQQQLDDAQIIDVYNLAAGRLNDRATEVLRGVTGEDFGEDPKAWRTWWVDQLGYSYQAPPPQPVPTIVENVPLAYLPQGVATLALSQAGPTSSTTTVSSAFTPGGVRHNCFEAGTLVRTLAGPKPIETIRVGDRVLSQDVRTGALSYPPVVAVFHNRPAATLRIDLGNETIGATTIHRFWRAGQGWVMARDLKPGDRLRTLGGMAEVRSVSPDRVQPVFNLQVAEGSSFFVGRSGTLAHDNSLVEPVSAPFDAAPPLAAAPRERN